MGKLKIINQVIDNTIIKNTLIELGEVSIIVLHRGHNHHLDNHHYYNIRSLFQRRLLVLQRVMLLVSGMFLESLGVT